jgi:F0F1-type ATP synthase epsilon subunit
MTGMAPLLGRLGKGQLRIDTEDGRTTMTLEGGFAHVRGGALTLLTETATTD